MKILITYRWWSKCVPVNLKWTPMTFKIKLTHNFGPLSITFSLRCLFSAKWPYFLYLAVYGTENLNNSNQNDVGGSFQFIGTHFYHNQNKIQNFHSFSFAFLQVLLGGMWNFQTPYTGGSSELISKLLSSMLLYNHSPYFKSAEINSNRLSPLPTSMLWSYLYL